MIVIKTASSLLLHYFQVERHQSAALKHIQIQSKINTESSFKGNFTLLVPVIYYEWSLLYVYCYKIPVYIGYWFSWRDASLGLDGRRTYRKRRLLKKGWKTTVMSYTITTTEVSFINVLVLSLSNLASTNKSHTWLWEISKDLNFLIYANTASPLRFIFLTWAYKKHRKCVWWL